MWQHSPALPRVQRIIYSISTHTVLLSVTAKIYQNIALLSNVCNYELPFKTPRHIKSFRLIYSEENSY